MIDKEMRSIAERFEMEILSDVSEFSFVKDSVQKIPYLFAKQKGVLPIDEDEKEVLVAIADPLDLNSIEELHLLLNKNICPYYCPREILEEAIERCYHQKDEDTSHLFSENSSEKQITSDEVETEGYDLLEQSTDNPVIRILNVTIIEAIQQGASDIHFEPKEVGLIIRYRIDGILQKRRSPPNEYQSQIITRIKVMARLDIAEHRLPQDGRLKLRMGGREIDFRVSTIPVVHGERVVLRILDKGNINLGLEHLGMNEKILNAFRKLIQLPEGILLVTGPTGSGKTTTLYSAISEINAGEMNIMTIEDPVEYKLPNIAQIGVNPKIQLNFSTGLRHILRQDPDVIMIGEIRDKETAEIAIQSALTGHLVLSTLHTNDAPSAITRLVDMGIEPYLLSSSIIGVLAQRLVRKICSRCRFNYVPSKEELQEIRIDPNSLPEGGLFKGKGCDFCFGTGYKGRHGIYELLCVNASVKKQMIKSFDSDGIRRVAVDFIDLRSSGSELIKRGLTTSSEVLRATRLCEDILLE